MRIFLSYSSRDRESAERVYLALRGQGHRLFFDRSALRAGEEYDARIRRAIEGAHLFVFLISPDSIRAGSYARTELAIAQRSWEHPTGRVLPVLLRAVELDALPPYLRSVTWLEPEGDVPAAVLDAVHRLATARRRRLLGRSAAAAALSALLAAGAFAALGRGPPSETTGRDGAPMLLVPEGAFTMGDDEHAPRREAFLDAFYIDRHEVTVGRYARFLEATGGVSPPEGWPPADLAAAAELPVVGIDWHDADQYCRWAGRRLPSEAEWEKAARGADARTYPWGDDEPTPAHARFGGSAAWDAYAQGLAAAGSHPAGRSPYGADDMAGNVAEWVADWFAEGFRRGDVRHPGGPADGDARVIRGGAWVEPPDRLQAARRMYADPSTRLDHLGFRCARDAGRG